MLTLRSDNRVLTNNAKSAYLVQNYQSGVTSVEVSNSEPFSADDPILLGEMGQTDAEILKIDSISGRTISLANINSAATNSTYSHPESTRVTVLPYDQVRFYWTALLGTIADEAPTFVVATATALTDWTALDPTSYYSTYSDTVHSTGFGWFLYKNSYSGQISSQSNPIPYAGFTLNTVQQVFSDFDSLLNTNELKLVSLNDKFAWLNEALAILKNKLNLTNAEYLVSSSQTITTTASTAEYILPDDFSDIVEITDSDELAVSFLPVSQVMVNNGLNPGTTQYYLRGRYIGFSPTPDTTGTLYYYTYRSKAARVSNLSTYIDLPDNLFYCLKDWMMYRSFLKFNNPLATAYYQSFKNSIDLGMQSAVKRSANLDSWNILDSANT